MLDRKLQNFGLFELSTVRISRCCWHQSSKLTEGCVYSVASFFLDHSSSTFPRGVLTRVTSWRITPVTIEQTKIQHILNDRFNGISRLLQTIGMILRLFSETERKRITFFKITSKILEKYNKKSFTITKKHSTRYVSKNKKIDHSVYNKVQPHRV